MKNAEAETGDEPTVGDGRRVGAHMAQELAADPILCDLPNHRVEVEGRSSVAGNGPCGLVRGQ